MMMAYSSFFVNSIVGFGSSTCRLLCSDGCQGGLARQFVSYLGEIALEHGSYESCDCEQVGLDLLLGGLERLSWLVANANWIAKLGQLACLFLSSRALLALLLLFAQLICLEILEASLAQLNDCLARVDLGLLGVDKRSLLGDEP